VSVVTTRLYLVRHGATNLTAEDRFSGATGELSSEGRRQMERLAARMRDAGVVALYSSDLVRALASARILGEAMGLEPDVREELREIHHGHWEGLTQSEVAERFPAEYAAYQSDPYRSAPAGGESGQVVLKRAMPAVREIVASHEGQRVLVVSHKATLRLAICELLGIDPRWYRDKIDQAPACLDAVDFFDERPPRLILLNDVSHYEEI
jgi:broad specificity phosphatase PhoE